MKAKRILINLSVFLLSAFIIVYIIVQLVSTLSTDVSYQYASAEKVSDTLEKTGYIVRNETVLFSEQNGILTYSVSESQKIGSNQLIATAYSNSQGVDVQKKIQKIDQKIALLERSAVDTSYLTSDISKIDSKIFDSLVKTRLAVNHNEIYLAQQHKDDLIINFNKRQLITANTENFDKEIAALHTQKDQLTSSLQNPLCSVYSPVPGYFSTLLDGFESIYTPDVVKNLTVDSFHDLIGRQKAEQSDLAVGKVITDYDWYTLCEATKDEAADFIIGKRYPVTYLYSSGRQMKAKLEKIVTQTDTDLVVLVFLIEEVPQDFDYTRKQNIRIEMSSVDGISFPKSALRLIDDVQGVYVISGNAVAFRKVDIIYSSDSHYFSAEKGPGDENAKEYLSKFDRVITEGKDLYIGKILD